MASSHLLEQVAAIERSVSVPQLHELLTEVVPQEDLVPYSEMLGSQPSLAGIGSTADALERIGSDLGASDTFAVSILAGALLRVVARQQEHIEALEKAPAAKSTAKTKGEAKK